MNLKTPQNANYCAVVVVLDKFIVLPNCDNVQAAIIFGNSVIVGKNQTAGDIGLFFPAETQLSKAFIGNNNLFRKPEWGNADPLQKGFFEEHGRVKAVKFRGNKSEGFWIPLTSLAFTKIPLSEFTVGMEFDELNGEEICRKYVPKHNPASQRSGLGKVEKRENRLVEGQFRFHIDTAQLRRNVHAILPDQMISVSCKFHGTSAIIANLLVKRKLNWVDRLLMKFGVAIQEMQYGLIWSSRRVVKGIDGEAKATAVHYYSSDVWGTVAKELAPVIQKGMTIYAEIVGYTPDGKAIQSMGGKPYAYGCAANQHRTLVYRITQTNADGKVLEFSWAQMKEYCAKFGLEMVVELFHGKAKDFYPETPGQTLADWQAGFLNKLEIMYVRDQMCSYNNFQLPAEGVVVKVDALDNDPAYKLKNFAFLAAETNALDTGTVDMETIESECLQFEPIS